MNSQACGYCRGSTVEQIDTLTVQGNQISAYCDYRQLTMAGPDGARCFVDSGTSGSVPFYERPVAATMVHWMVENGVKNLVITKLDRGFRDALDCLFTIADLEKKGITVHLLDLQLDMSTPVGKMVLTVLAAIAELENKRRSERQRDAFKVRRAQKKICGTIPYGYSGATPAGDLIPDAQEQIILTRIVTGDLAACSCNEAARRLNLEGVSAKRGGKWFGATVANIRRQTEPASA